MTAPPDENGRMARLRRWSERQAVSRTVAADEPAANLEGSPTSSTPEGPLIHGAGTPTEPASSIPTGRPWARRGCSCLAIALPIALAAFAAMQGLGEQLRETFHNVETR